MPKKLSGFSTSPNSLHLVTRPILIATRCIGLFPVSGLFSASPNMLKFVIKSPYTLLVLASFSGLCMLCILNLLHLFDSGSTPRAFYKFVVTMAGVIGALTVLNLARHWPTVVQQVTVIEKSLPQFNKKRIRISCNIAAVIVFLCAAVDHILSSRFYWQLTGACPKGKSHMESYYLYTLPSISAYIPFNTALFLFIQVLYVQIIFIGNLTDVIIIVISFYLTAYFEEFNDLINLYKDKSPNMWNVLRAHYTKLTRKVKIIDDSVSFFVLFSFGFNMALICVQLFKILRKNQAHEVADCEDEAAVTKVLKSLDRALYFNFSIAFLVTRAVITALCATKVHKAGRAPLLTLYEVPAENYNVEARRFVEQMHANTIALSGQHFFYVTRGMILTMVATIFTYELVLLQFSDCKK